MRVAFGIMPLSATPLTKAKILHVGMPIISGNVVVVVVVCMMRIDGGIIQTLVEGLCGSRASVGF